MTSSSVKGMSVSKTGQAVLFSIFKFFSTLKLAIILLVSLMIVLTAGTLIESGQGADAAKLLVYDTPWFAVLLFVLGINVAGAAIDRIPWKKKHTGFVITHVGILVILAGSFVTRSSMIDGQMVLAEGETESRITLPQPILYLFSEGSRREWLIPVPKKALPWSGRQRVKTVPAAGLPEIYLTAYYPKAEFSTRWTARESGPPALRVRVHNSFVDESLWLVLGDSNHGSVQLGPATFSFAGEPLEAPAAEKAPEAGYLEFQFENKSIPVAVTEDMKLPAEAPLKGTDYRIIVEKIYRNAMVAGKTLVEEPEAEAGGPGKNPAVKLTVKGPDFSENHTVFANFPEFPTVHGMVPSRTGARVFYRLPGGGSRGESHELRFTQTKVGARHASPSNNDSTRTTHASSLHYQIQDGLNIQTGDVVIGEEIGLGWMDLKFEVEEYLPAAAQERNFRPAHNLTESPTALTAMEIEIVENGEAKRIWLGQGMLETASAGGRNFHLMFGQRRIPSEFKLQLKDFRLENYPGTNNPASFESDVILKDDARGVFREETISMNEPLEYRGFKVYQSGYQMPEQPGEPEISIFSVGRDPGVPFQYAGTIIMVTGVITMFFTRKFSTTAGQLK